MARYNSNGSGAYPEYAQASSGGPTFPVFGTINEPYAQTSPNARLQFGDQIVDAFGNVYLYVRAVAALAVGQVVRYAIPGDGDVPAAGTVSASTTTKVIWTNITTTLDESKLGSMIGYAGTTGGFKYIKAQDDIGTNTKFTVSKLQTMFGIGKYDGDELAAIPTTGDAVVIVRPYNVAVGGAAAAAEGAPVGVALGTVSSAGGTLILTQGNAQVLGVGNKAATDAIVAGGPLFMNTGGTVTGPVSTATAETVLIELPSLVGQSHIAWASASGPIPAFIRCLRNA